MNAEEAKKIADNALETLAKSLENGKSEAITQYLAMMARFHRYSFGNILLIHFQKPDATHVAGFTTWKTMKRFVRKGERGIVIIAPMTIRPKDDVRQTDPDKPAKAILRFRGVHVFDVSQTDGEPLPAPSKVQGDPSEHLGRLKASIAGRGIILDHDDVPSGAEGVSRGGRISIRPDLPVAEEFSVLVHELAHELLHRGEDRKTISKTVRETEAEAVAFVVTSAIGLDTGTAASDYIQLYQGTGEKAVETLAASLDRIQRVAAEIIAGISATTKNDDSVEQRSEVCVAAAGYELRAHAS